MAPRDGLGHLKPRRRHRTVDRIALILEIAARSIDGISLSGIARKLDAPVSSVQALVDGLVASGYLVERDRSYALGGAPYLLNRLAGRSPVATVTYEHLAAIHAQTGLSTVLSIAVAADVFYVDYCSTDPRFAYLAENYVRRSLIRTSAGWVLLADMEKRDLWRYIASVPDGDQAVVDKFFAALPLIEQTGICAAPQASEQGDGVSIAVRELGKTVAAVGIVATAEEIGGRRDALVEVLKLAAAAWSDALPE
jgi:DNA-binding IclR family transcriptional regulator